MRITILGATGSIGQSTLRLVEQSGGALEVYALTGSQNIEQLAKDARAVQARVVVTNDPRKRDDLRGLLVDTSIQVMAGEAALLEIAAHSVDMVVCAIVGAAGVAPSLAALGAGNDVALANKETMVCAGRLAFEIAQTNGSAIYPVDSEHTALMQLVRHEARSEISKVTITASGGAFLHMPLDEMRHVTPEQAATHPNWDMGQRITIDSASMFNKALEVIEAKELFGLDPSQIDVLIHPQSIVHAIAHFVDGSSVMHMGQPDMRQAISYALGYGTRRDIGLSTVDLAHLGQLSFAAPDDAKYPALRLVRGVMDIGGHAGAVFNAAKEEALDAFIARKIKFLQMAEVVERVLDIMSQDASLTSAVKTVETVLHYNDRARSTARDVITAHYS